MPDNSKSSPAFDEIRDYSVKQLSKLFTDALAHIEKSCTELLNDFSAKTEEKETADKILGYIQLNRNALTTPFLEEFSRILRGEKVVDEKKKDDGLSLSLVDDDILEEMLLIGSLSGKIQDHYELYLKTIKRGVVRLTKQMESEPEPDALTPKNLMMLLHHLLADAELVLSAKKIIYIKFSEIFHISLEDLYDGVLALMQDHQIVTESENPASEKFKVIYEYRQNRTQAQAAPPATIPPDGNISQAGDQNSMPAATGPSSYSHAPMSPASLAPVSASAMNANLFNDSAESQALYKYLSGMPLSPNAQAASGGGKAMPAMQSDDLLKLLSSLQNLNTQQLAESALGNATAISEQINQTVYGKAKELSQQLSGPESNVIELVNQMFITILEDPNLPDIVKVQIGRLQIPYIKVALLDVTLLKQQAHPARLLLNELAQQGARINSRDDAFFQLILSITQNILDQFENNLNVFTENLKKLRKKAESELEQAEEAEQETRGKAESHAKVLHVKKRVVARLRQFLQGKKLPAELHAVTLKGFAPLFLKIYRREGEDSPAWQKATTIFRQLIESVQPRTSLYQQEIVIERSGEILAQTQTALESIAGKGGNQDLLKGLQKFYQQQTKEYERLKQQGFDDADEEKIDPFAEIEPIEMLEEPPEMANQPSPAELLQRLPVDIQPGAWCEVYIGRDQPSKRLKVSSILQDTAQIVFVDSSGKQAEIKDAGDFIDELDCERSTIIHDEHLFDKALTAVLSNMKMMRAATA